eukprot:TRINITY_DN10395_c0_g1_i2.p1 TRINITY_DN10395_c0_g1~~TRINITY_DN10395_c0_g1_i2.p1  ORF type:complete len:612 (+),score=176.95 TRINITY_DN10395_c0_g1_i2:64-1899(+)
MYRVCKTITRARPLQLSRSTSYKAPIRDVKFLFDEVLDAQKGFPPHATPDVVDMVVGEVAKFSESVLHPIWKIGDAGCQFDGSDVTTPPGWKEAYQQYVEGGWPTVSAAEEFGGQGFPHLIDMVKAEFCATANWTWFMYPMLSHGAVETIVAHASPEMQAMFLPKLVSGEWTGTMDLTEGNAGSDLGQVKTKAIPTDDGRYRITGSKIFISCGEADFSENIIHLVLAKLPDAPAGTKGISLFIVPKYLVNEDGSLETTKNCVAGGIEHKMGIKGSATAVMNFDGSIGYLVGKPHDGMRQMFSFMNTARLHVGVQGLGAAELAYQNALPYARERLAGRSPGGPTNPDKPGDPILAHPEVRRMLLTMKSFSEGARCLVYYAAQLLDGSLHHPDEATRQDMDQELGLLTPIVKAFISELANEMASHGIQVYGGHGFIGEWGMEQIARDVRISTLYEGTTGIQSLDLLGRKVMMNRGAVLSAFCDKMVAFCDAQTDPELRPHCEAVKAAAADWLQVTKEILLRAKDPSQLESSAVDYLYFSGYVTFSYMWLLMEAKARLRLAEKPTDPEFYEAKIKTSAFWFNRMLPRMQAHKITMLAPTSDLTAMNDEEFAFLE